MAVARLRRKQPRAEMDLRTVGRKGKSQWKRRSALCPLKMPSTPPDLSVSAADMKELLDVNKDEWKKEVASIREHYAKFGDRLPEELKIELDALEKRLS